MQLLDREVEKELLAGLLQAAKRGKSGTIVLRGEAGIGKSALIDHAMESATGMRVLRVTGVVAESELGYAGLHRLMLPLLDRLSGLPIPQRAALESAFGMAEGIAPDPFLVGLAVLTLLTDHAETRPVLCVCDDAQWLDDESLRTLAFVARRLQADRVAILVGLRGTDGLTALDDLPTHLVTGLATQAAHTLLASTVKDRLDPRTADRIVIETGGNPLAICELGRELIARREPPIPLSERLPMGRQLEAGFLRRVGMLPEHTRTLLLVTAADPTGDPGLVWRTVLHLKASGGAPDLISAAEPAVTAGLINTHRVIGFRHPLMRSAVYGGAADGLRRAVHSALAAMTDRDTDADRRAWHLAAATAHLDEDVAAELERSAHHARLRGGFAAEATLLAHAAGLSPHPAKRTARLVAAAGAAQAAGHVQRAEHLLDQAEPALDDGSAADAMRLRGMLLLHTSRSEQAIGVLLRAATLFQDHHIAPVTESLLAAFEAAAISPWTVTDKSLHDLAEFALRFVRDSEQSESGARTLLRGHATAVIEGFDASAPFLRAALTAIRRRTPEEEPSSWLVLSGTAAMQLWDDEAISTIAVNEADRARERGDLQVLRRALHCQAMLRIWRGQFAAAGLLFAECDELSAVIGSSRVGSPGEVLLLAWQGDETRTRQAAARLLSLGPAEPQAVGGHMVQLARTALAVLELGRGNYREALDAAHRAFDDDFAFFNTPPLPELLEAAVRGGQPDVARAVLDRLAERAAAAGTPWALGLLARSRALLTDEPEQHYAEAIRLLEGTGIITDLARAHLLYGEWLRRVRRRTEAGLHLAKAHTMFTTMGANDFAERARAELIAGGHRPPKRSVESTDGLTPREAQIAALAAHGATNQEIATRLYISANTVDYHLRKVFMKLSITSRRQLRERLSRIDGQDWTTPVRG
ncbi:helix-turn-helix transcriptional regulator [Planotetraspora kaengkrachanensis]|uniref:LuxR family transcriptional regulator n=1 Tax=Planotetraspora kaengkrachanensis TaxID=575193 RepID=A0A8J3PRP2_9ACTN|nr:LuxR family transcriptional regulator [Planotetraspora kaengkrachanensis]GIG78619.1 LuxR family transcriptional regulator [Planotetraspora kaengkrachanensis]